MKTTTQQTELQTAQSTADVITNSLVTKHEPTDYYIIEEANSNNTLSTYLIFEHTDNVNTRYQPIKIDVSTTTPTIMKPHVITTFAVGTFDATPNNEDLLSLFTTDNIINVENEQPPYISTIEYKKTSVKARQMIQTARNYNIEYLDFLISTVNDQTTAELLQTLHSVEQKQDGRHKLVRRLQSAIKKQKLEGKAIIKQLKHERYKIDGTYAKLNKAKQAVKKLEIKIKGGGQKARFR